jgi:hypothetical protein
MKVGAGTAASVLNAGLLANFAGVLQKTLPHLPFGGDVVSSMINSYGFYPVLFFALITWDGVTDTLDNLVGASAGTVLAWLDTLPQTLRAKIPFFDKAYELIKNKARTRASPGGRLQRHTRAPSAHHRAGRAVPAGADASRVHPAAWPPRKLTRSRRSVRARNTRRKRGARASKRAA